MVRSELFQTSSNLSESLPNQFALFLSFQLTKETRLTEIATLKVSFQDPVPVQMIITLNLKYSEDLPAFCAGK